jgi:hypothetical protein
VVVTPPSSRAVAADLRVPLAAVLDQESEQRADALQLDGINDAPLVAA